MIRVLPEEPIHFIDLRFSISECFGDTEAPEEIVPRLRVMYPQRQIQFLRSPQETVLR
jgi:hypothetical protein